MTDSVGDLDVLVVDDDQLLANLARRALVAIGVRSVETVGSGPSALALLDESDGDFGLLLCDLAMPGMDGVEFLRHLAERHFTGYVVVMSGQDGRVIDSVVNLASTAQLQVIGALHKPFTLPALRELLGRIGQRPLAASAQASAQVGPAELERAIANGELFLHFQPKMDIQSGAVHGVEALARWQHPDKGTISPACFIPLAEENSLMRELTDAVLTKAVGQCRQWQAGALDLKIAVNVPAELLSDLDLPDRIAAITDAGGISPASLSIEVTETQLMRDVVKSLDTLNRLRLKGLSLSIDDFGTGYSSMSQLQRVPFQELKVDRSFVQRAVDDPVSLAIVESSVQLALGVGMRIVAEGVETAEQLALVRQLGCHEAQGFYIARPMAGDAMEAWLQRHAAGDHLQHVTSGR